MLEFLKSAVVALGFVSALGGAFSEARAQSAALTLATTPWRSAHQVLWRIEGGASGSPYALCADVLPGDVGLIGGARLRLALTPALTVVAVGSFDASGRAHGLLALPPDSTWSGRTIFVQAVGYDVTSGWLRTSNRLDATIEPTRAAHVPSWEATTPTQIAVIDFDPALNSAQNGDRLHNQLQALQPGDALVVGAGRWSLERRVDLGLQGTATAPIRVLAAPGARPVMTRSDASQNVLNIGDWQPARFLLLRGFEITGGSFGIRIYEAEDCWIDACDVHDIAGSAISANSGDCARLYLTRNEVHATGGVGEGLYLGANNGVYVVRDSVIAKNHVYDTRNGTQQGDGIELKQGSFGNLIAENYVHGTRYPCILVYGTAGRAPNVIENNVCIDALDVVMQVQGEALVRNNLLISGSIGFLSRDHQGQVRDLQFVHNTVINIGAGAYLRNWDSKPGMLFANNAIYSRDAAAVEFASGSIGATVQGNVVFGGLIQMPGGYVRGAGLADFAQVRWDASAVDARPARGSVLFGSGDPNFAEAFDLLGRLRTNSLESGCLDGT